MPLKYQTHVLHKNIPNQTNLGFFQRRSLTSIGQISISSIFYHFLWEDGWKITQSIYTGVSCIFDKSRHDNYRLGEKIVSCKEYVLVKRLAMKTGTIMNDWDSKEKVIKMIYNDTKKAQGDHI